MPACERRVGRAMRRLLATRSEIGQELRDARVSAGWSQEAVALAAGMSRVKVTRLELGIPSRFDLEDVARVASVLGLDPVLRLYPGAGPPRDAAHAAKLGALLVHARSPLRVRTEVPLPARDDHVELRAWDADVTGGARRTRFELEMRLRDLQALERRQRLKLRDDPGDGFVLLIAETHANRDALRGAPAFFQDLPRLGPSRVIKCLEAGEHPPSCLTVL